MRKSDSGMSRFVFQVLKLNFTHDVILYQVLTLRAGEMTTGRRSSPVPQLSCVGGSGAGRGWEPSVVQCSNRGWDGREVQWECKADMEAAVRFGRVEVVCEGYDYAEDDYILELEAGLTPTEEPPTTMELVVEVTTEDLQTLVEVVDREVLELEVLGEEVVASGLEQLQVIMM